MYLLSDLNENLLSLCEKMLNGAFISPIVYGLAQLVKRFNTSGCEPVTHGFESRIAPHLALIALIQNIGAFLLFFGLFWRF